MVNLAWLPLTIAFEVTPGLTAGDILQVATVIVSIFTAFQAIKGRQTAMETELRVLGARIEGMEARMRRRRREYLDAQDEDEDTDG